METCLNSWPFVSLPYDGDGVELPHCQDQKKLYLIPHSPTVLFLLHLCHLCQALARQFWQRWSVEYMYMYIIICIQSEMLCNVALSLKELNIEHVVVLHKEIVIPQKWPLQHSQEKYWKGQTCLSCHWEDKFWNDPLTNDAICVHSLWTLLPPSESLAYKHIPLVHGIWTCH